MTEKRPPRDEEEPKKPKFKVVDRRRINPDEIEAADAPVEPPEPEIKADVPAETPVASKPKTDKSSDKFGKMPPTEEEPEFKIASDDKEPLNDKPPAQGEIRPEEDPLHIQNLSISLLQTVASVALVNLGLVPHPQTNLIAKKLEEARKVIELFEVILKKVGPDLPAQIQTEFLRALQDLKTNYVNQL